MRRAYIVGFALADTLLLTACSILPSATPARATEPRWRYEVTAGPAAEKLAVVAEFDGDTDSELTVNEGAEPYIRDVEALEKRGWTRLETRKGSWFLPSPCRAGCVVRYKVLLRDAAQAEQDTAVARLFDFAIVAPPSTWLLRPARSRAPTPRFGVPRDDGPRRRVRQRRLPRARPRPAPMRASPTTTTSSPTPPSAVSGSATSTAGANPCRDPPRAYSNADDVDRPPGSRPRRARWKGSTALFPVASPAWSSRSADRRDILGRLRDDDGPLRRGHRDRRRRAARRPRISAGDWVLVHEMVHTALPGPRRDPSTGSRRGSRRTSSRSSRRRAGLRTTAQVWAEWVTRNAPRTARGRETAGSTATPTWGAHLLGRRALLPARGRRDPAAHEQRALARRRPPRRPGRRAGASRRAGPVERVSSGWGDAATGVPVLRELYDKMAVAPVGVDLADLWKRLGVSVRGNAVTFDDAAPLASVRRGITEEGARP
jgi:hypothetical protein